jgi:hypothetical protein
MIYLILRKNGRLDFRKTKPKHGRYMPIVPIEHNAHVLQRAAEFCDIGFDYGKSY